jgi:hypothetical protein
LCMALVTLLEASDSPPTTTTTTTATTTTSTSATTTPILDALLSGLSPDPRAFATLEPLDALTDMKTERAFIQETLAAHRDRLRGEFATRVPGGAGYAPLNFSFNFPHNLVKGLVVDAVLRGTPGDVSMNALLTPSAGGDASRAETAARTLMGFAIASPDTIRGRPHPAIVYDASVGRRAFDRALRALD